MKLIVKRNFESLLKAVPLVVVMALPGIGQSQSLPNPAAAERSIEQGLQLLERPVRPLAEPAPERTVVSPEVEPDIRKLVSVQATVPTEFSRLKRSIDQYWSDFIGKPVRGVQISGFKAWVWDELVRLGYLAYVNVTVEQVPEGEVIQVIVSAPTLGRVTVVNIDAENVNDRYADIISQRFARVYQEGTIIDVTDIESQLDAMAYDLPVDLQVALRRTADGKVDVVVDVKRIDTKPGSINSGILQFNTYGLRAYGREQVLGVVRVQGPRPLSEFVGIAEASLGLLYLRGEYSQAIEGYASRWNVFAAGSMTSADAKLGFGDYKQVGNFYQVGAGVTRLLSAGRAGSWFSNVEASYRESESELRGLVKTRQRQDAQLGLGLRSSHSYDWANQLMTNTLVTVGDLTLGREDISYRQFDAKNIEGFYAKLNHNGSYQQAISSDYTWTVSARWRFQVASQNMDSYNQISLGGVSGIRAFDSDEGVGDQGAQASIDLIKQLAHNVYAGVFYDIGVVQTRRIPSTTAYWLQGAGAILGGNFTDTLSFNFSIAKSFGPTPQEPFAITGRIGDWRGFFALTQRF